MIDYSLYGHIDSWGFILVLTVKDAISSYGWNKQGNQCSKKDSTPDNSYIFYAS